MAGRARQGVDRQAGAVHGRAPNSARVRPGVAGRPPTLLLALAVGLLAGCAGPKYTVDDGRKVNEELLAQIRHYGTGERAIRPAIVRSAALADPDCDKQWELPFSVATSEAWAADDRVAWVRALGVDERLTVVAASPLSPLRPGERIVEIEGLRGDRPAEEMSLQMVKHRDRGDHFAIVTDSGRRVSVAPFEVCRGYTRFAPPNTPQLQDYHWLLSLHPLQAAEAGLTDDEALWAVLWTQGLSEEGGLRMKAYHYTTSLVGTLYNVATLASGLKGAAVAAEAAVRAAQAAAAKVATEVLKQQLIDQASSFAMQKVRDGLTGAADRLSRQQLVDFMQRAATNRGALGGVARIGATVFDRADAWAFQRAPKLQGDPLAGFRLHQKMAEMGFASNAFALDTDRLSALTKLAESSGLGEGALAAVKGVRPEELQVALAAMPLATAPRPFRYEDAVQAPGADPFAFGLIDAMLGMPLASQGRQ